MSKAARALTPRIISRAKPTAKTYGIADAEVRGLRIVVRPHGTKNYAFRYQRHGVEHLMALGHVDDIELEEARDLAREARKRLRAGLDPLLYKRDSRAQARTAEQQEQQARAAEKTFGDVTTAWLAAKEPHWSSAHFKKTTSLIETSLLHRLKKKPVASVDAAMLLDVLRERYNAGKKESARTARSIAAAIIEYAKRPGGELPKTHINPARELIGTPLLKKPTVQQRTALPADQVGAFLYALDLAKQSERISPQVYAATLTAMLTGSREGAVRAMRWDDLDLNKAIWNVRPETTKSKRPFTTFLPRMACDAIRALPRSKGNGYVFGSPSNPTHMLSSNTLRLTLHRLGFPFTAHGFRSLLVDWAHEQQRWSTEVIARLIDHALPDLQAAYTRTEFNGLRRELLNAWGVWCENALGDAARA